MRVILLALLVPVLPGIFWLWVFYRTDRYEPEPLHLVLANFALGVAAIVPAFLLEQLGGLIYPYVDAVSAAAAGQLEGSALPIFLGCFLVIGPVEEVCKFLVVRLWVYRHPEFDEPLDGIVYAAAAALGFASIENVLYVIDFNQGGAIHWSMLLARSLMALPGHVIFAATWGYALGRARFQPGYPVWAMLVGAAALHGLYDFLLMYPPARPLCLLFMGVMVPVMVRQIRTLRAESPFQPGGPRAAEVAPLGPRVPLAGVTPLLTACPACSTLAPWADHGCARCGTSLDKRVIYCGRCRGKVALPTDAACRTCGAAISLV